MDVRSEGEFHEGHIQGARNIPLLNNEERAIVGTDYKQRGQAQAIKTAFKLVGPRLYEIILAAEAVGPEVLVHCWRGGMRSANFCHFVNMARMKTHQLKGGYKAYRQFALQYFHHALSLLVIGGCTGSGKSELLRKLKAEGEQVIDLEQLANHRGSAFGGLLMPPQPTTEQFQNDLFEEIFQFDLKKRIWIEDEAIAVGKIFLPEPLWRQMLHAPLIEVVVDKANRVHRLVEEYGAADRYDFLGAMEKITKKLGGQHFLAAKEKLMQNDLAGAIEILLTYYDKAYIASMDKKRERVKYTLSWDGNNEKNIIGQLKQISI